MSTHLKGRYEEVRKKKMMRGVSFILGGIVLLIFVFSMPYLFSYSPLAEKIMNPFFCVSMILPLIGTLLLPSDEEHTLAKAEKDKRIAEQVLFDDSVRKIHRDHKLNQITQGLVQRTATNIVTVVDPEIVNICRQYELEALQGKEQSKQLAHEIKMLAEKIRTLKHLERDTLSIMEDLEQTKIIDPDEAALFKELIKDKVMEGIHVDRRGGRSRYKS